MKLQNGENAEENTFLSQLAQSLIEEEWDLLDSAIEHHSCTIHPGSFLNQAVIVNSHQSNLHYRAVPKSHSATLMYISKKEFLAVLEKVNESAQNKFLDYMDNIPAFQNLSKAVRRKLMHSGRALKVQKGWLYNSQVPANTFAVVMKG